MAIIFPKDDLEIADAGGAKVQVLPAGATGGADLWTRADQLSGATAPDFALNGGFSSVTTVTSGALPVGGLFQARLFRAGEGPAGVVLGMLDFPVLAREARTNYLTACAELPQVDITVGGTFASIIVRDERQNHCARATGDDSARTQRNLSLLQTQRRSRLHLVAGAEASASGVAAGSAHRSTDV